jgi:hypothetical protein
MDSWIIEAAIIGFEAQRKQVDSRIAELRQMLGQSPGKAAEACVAVPGKRTMSAAGRRAIAEAQRKRWAKRSAQNSSTGKLVPTSKPKRKLSTAGRAAIVAALKRRWAAKRAATAS